MGRTLIYGSCTVCVCVCVCCVSLSVIRSNNNPLRLQWVRRRGQDRERKKNGMTHVQLVMQSSWNVMAHCNAREGKWRGNWRMEWVVSTLHTTSKRGVSSITTADAHTSGASSRLNWRPRRFKWTRPFRRKTKSGFSACAITWQTQSTFADRRKEPPPPSGDRKPTLSQNLRGVVNFITITK
jgi:hypothetical protein